MKRSVYQDTVVMTKTLGDGITVLNANNGVLAIRGEAEDTEDLLGRYYWDVEMIIAGAKYTVPEELGELLVKPDVTREEV